MPITRTSRRRAEPKATFLQIPEAKRQRVLSEAAKSFAAHGLEQTDMGELAARVGVAKGSLYNYFASKEALYEYVCRDALERSRAAVYGALDPEADIYAQVEHVFRAGLRFARAHPEYVAMYLSLTSAGMETFSRRLSLEVEKRTADQLKGALQRGIRDGSVRGDLDAGIAAFTINGLYIFFMASLASEHWRIRMREYLEIEGALAGALEAQLVRLIEQIHRILRPLAPAGASGA